MGRRFWVGCGFSSWGVRGGEEDSSGQVLQSRFRRRHSGSNNPIFYVIYYILISGGFVVPSFKTITNIFPESRYFGQTRNSWYGVLYTYGLCYMLFLLYVI